MVEPLQKISFHTETRYESLRLARKLVARAARVAGADGRAEAEIEVAVGEALSNAHVHAYHGEVGPIQIDVAIGEGQFAVTVHDHGAPVTPPVFPKDRPLVSGSGGRGLYLMANLMDEAVVERRDAEGRGTSIRMVKKLS